MRSLPVFHLACTEVCPGRKWAFACARVPEQGVEIVLIIGSSFILRRRQSSLVCMPCTCGMTARNSGSRSHLERLGRQRTSLCLHTKHPRFIYQDQMSLLINRPGAAKKCYFFEFRQGAASGLRSLQPQADVRVFNVFKSAALMFQCCDNNPVPAVCSHWD